MSNETQTTIDTDDNGNAVATQDSAPKTILPVIGPITDDGVVVMSDAPYSPDTTYVMAADTDSLTLANVQAAVTALTANDGAPPSPLLTREEMAEPLLTSEPETPAPEREKVWNIHLQAWV